MVSIHENAVAIPGERLGSLEQFSPGNGTYVRRGHVYASLAGYKQLQEQENREVCLEEICQKLVELVEFPVFHVIYGVNVKALAA